MKYRLNAVNTPRSVPPLTDATNYTVNADASMFEQHFTVLAAPGGEGLKYFLYS